MCVCVCDTAVEIAQLENDSWCLTTTHILHGILRKYTGACIFMFYILDYRWLYKYYTAQISLRIYIYICIFGSKVQHTGKPTAHLSNKCIVYNRNLLSAAGDSCPALSRAMRLTSSSEKEVSWRGSMGTSSRVLARTVM